MAKMVAACQSTATAEQRDELEFHERLVELLAYYRHEVLSINPSSITAVKAAAKYDASTSFDENMANHLAIIAAV